MTFPRWAIWVMNVVVLVLLYLVAQVAKLAPWELVGGWIIGNLSFYCLFRWHYGWWPDFNMDGEDEKNSQLPRIDPDRTNFR